MIDTPTKNTSAPIATNQIPPPTDVNNPARSAATPTPTVIEPAMARTRSDRRWGRASSSLMAAIGGTRAALRAGNRDETTVTTSPTVIPTITVRG